MEPFKEKFNRPLIAGMAQHLARVHSAFDTDGFITAASKNLDALELKERANQIAAALSEFMPADFALACDVMIRAHAPHEEQPTDPEGEGWEKDSADGITGWATWPVCDWVAAAGAGEPDLALETLKTLTPHMSAEFAVRPFLDRDFDATIAVMQSWITHECRHVRRLVSEGTRPRLPWGMQLKALINDPRPLIPALTALRDDKSEYVRRSVANHLNDIAKDHPDLVAEIAVDWLDGADINRTRLVRHACRTLIKQGHAATLAAFGYAPIAGLSASLDIETPAVRLGEALVFNAVFHCPVKADAVIDYVIHFVKANGKTAPKVFKWKTGVLLKGESTATRKHAIKPITTRKYYAGQHKLEILVNGASVASKEFELVMD